MPREIRIEDAKMKKNVEENKIKYPRKLRTRSRNKNAIEIPKEKLRKSTRMWRKQEFRNERRKLRNRGNRWEKKSKKIQENFSQLQNTNSQIERLHSGHNENRSSKDISLKNVRTRVTRKILKDSREDKTS